MYKLELGNKVTSCGMVNTGDHSPIIIYVAIIIAIFVILGIIVIADKIKRWREEKDLED